MSELRIAIAGLGTVGAGTLRLLQANADLIAARAGKKIVVKAVSARDKKRKRDCNLSGIEWADDAKSLAQRPDVDAVVELIGGANGAAKELAELSLKNGKHYITANKALLAAHGAELASLAEAGKLRLLFEASVAGGVPVIKALREGLAGNRVSVVRGILNGTCNYILTRMSEEGLDFADVLAEAQKKGYAEADPSADIDGHDTANKLTILAALAFGIAPDPASVHLEGIRRLTLLDLRFAAELGCNVKLLGVARANGKGIEQRVGPCLVPVSSPLATVSGAMNAVLLRGDFVGDITLEGQGAGAEPTASAVVADIIDLARGGSLPTFGVPAGQLKKPGSVPIGGTTRFYMRMQVLDKPGVVADISAILRDEEISIESLIQRGRADKGTVPVVMTAHEAKADAMRRAADKIARLPVVKEPPCLMPIED